MKKFLIIFLFSHLLFSEKIEFEKIFKAKYTKPFPYNFKYNKKEDSIYFIKKEEKIGLFKLNLKEKKEEILKIDFEPLAFEIFEDSFFLLGKDGWFKTSNLKEFEKITEISGGIFSPSYNFYAFYKDFNLYLFNLKEKKEIKVTEDGKKERFYGEVDWVYGEELDLKDGFKFSRDEKYLAFLQFNEEGVGKFPLTDYRNTYPEVDFQFYPKAGGKNPSVSLWIYDIEKEKKEILYSVDSERYLPLYTFTPDSKNLIFAVMPRDQKNLNFYKIDLKEREIKKIFKEEDKFWINLIQEPFFINERDFIWLSERENLALPLIYSLDGKIQKSIKRNYIVEKVIDFDENFIYFISISPDPLKREIIKYSLKDGKEENLFKKDGFLSVSKIENSPYFLIYYSKPYIPTIIYLLNKKNNEFFEIFNSRTEDFEKLELPEVEFLKIDELYASMIKPLNFNPEKIYPVIFYVYGGPHAQVVSERFGGSTFLFHCLLAQEGFLIFSLDNRGSYGRGKEFEGAIYRQFGKAELEDQLKGIGYLKKLPFVDSQRIGIWGWSYGGFMVLYSMTHSDVFKAGFAVAPVSDWNLYDTIYTERYLGLPWENKDGYFNSSPINFVKNLEGKLFLVHGTLDDNVHFHNSTNFIQELIKENISFDLMIYPERNHSIRDENARLHLFKEIINFFKKEL